MVRIVYISLLLIAPFMLNGQSLMNTGILTVQDSAILYIDGDFNLESTSTDTAVINSDGDIYVNGDWINESGKVFTDS
ncbi:MAG: hypothetical protein MRY83_12270, partial [Flavobacteriales bacterium]|nr:hypothetical protein [Flavobacteriales bacterium]